MPAHDEPLAVLVVGSAGSGKSTIARSLARNLRAVYLDKDSVCGPLAEVALTIAQADPDERESSDIYRARVMPAEYASLFLAAGDNLRNGLSVVVDAPFAAYLDDAGFLERSSESASWPQARVVVVRVSASEATTRRRLVERGLSRDLAKLGQWSAFWDKWGALPVLWSGARVLDVVNDRPVNPAELASLADDLRQSAK